MEEKLPAIPNVHRYRQLDSLRGLAALAVFMGHCLGVNINKPFQDAVFPTPLGILFNGNAAVIFFFVLSGFVLSLPFVNRERSLKLTGFYTKRIFRLYPAFIFALLFSIMLKEFVYDSKGMSPFSDWIKAFWNWKLDRMHLIEIIRTVPLIGANLHTKLLDPPIWSLVTEVRMSILLPVFIIIAARTGLVLNLLLFVVLIYLTGQSNEWAVNVFYLGILLARYKDGFLAKVKGWSLLPVIGAVIVAILLYNNTFEFLRQYQQMPSPFKLVWSNYLVALGSCLFIIIVLARNRIAGILNSRLFTFMGDISYSFYLVHFPVLLTISSLFSNYYRLSLPFIFLLSFLLSVLISWLMSVIIERSFQLMAANLTKKYQLFNY